MIFKLKRYISKWIHGKQRITNSEPSHILACEWCEKITFTTIEEVWSKADPSGHLVRMCKNCSEGCAGG